MSEPLQPALLNTSPPRSSSWRTWLGTAGVTWLWIINILLLSALCVWVWRDVRFMKPAYISIPLASQKSLPPLSSPTPLPEMIPMTAGRWLAFQVMVATAFVSFAGVFAALFVGGARHRQLRAWLAVVGLAAAWLALATSWRDLAWAGRRSRASRVIEAYEPIAAQLREHWPTQDGDAPGIGPFSAYPAGKARMLMPLNYQSPGKSGVPYAAVERSPEGALIFDLEGNLADVWLEWHPPGSEPKSFVGGLQTQFDLERATELGNGWYATHYQTGLASGSVPAP